MDLPLKQTSENVHAFTQFKNMAEIQFNKRIKVIQCDGGGEYKVVQRIAVETGIQFRMSCPYTSQQNGKAVTELGLTCWPRLRYPCITGGRPSQQ